MNVSAITPVPTEEEAAAITAAVTLMWPQPVAPATNEGRTNVSWRFSGRWWASNHISRRSRPGQ